MKQANVYVGNSNIFNKFYNVIPKWHGLIEESFLSDAMKLAYRTQIESMAARP